MRGRGEPVCPGTHEALQDLGDRLAHRRGHAPTALLAHQGPRLDHGEVPFFEDKGVALDASEHVVEDIVAGIVSDEHPG